MSVRVRLPNPAKPALGTEPQGAATWLVSLANRWLANGQPSRRWLVNHFALVAD